MKVIVAGSRTITDPSVVTLACMESGFQFSEIVSGGAAGVDLTGERLALKWGVPVKRFPADWKKWGRRAGPIRNREMAAYADALVLVWDGQSRGSASMLNEARQRGLQIHVHIHHDT